MSTDSSKRDESIHCLPLNGREDLSSVDSISTSTTLPQQQHQHPPDHGSEATTSTVMNTLRSTWYGWATLCVAGGGAYYFAKQSINADRQSRFDEEMKKKNRLARLEASGYARDSPSPAAKTKQPAKTDGRSSAHNTRGLDHVGSPSSEISEDAAPVGHAPVDNDQRMREKSKYEAAEPYRSRKGDRFS